MHNSTTAGDDQARMLAESAERFLLSRYPLTHRRGVIEAAVPDAGMWRSFAEMGWLALHVQEDDGGLGQPLVAAAPLLLALGRHLVVEPFVDAGLVSTYVLSAARFQQREDVMQAIVSGESLITPAHLERGMRMASALPKTRWQATPGGARLHGEKHAVPAGAAAHSWIITACDGAQESLRAWLVPADSPRVSARARTSVDGAPVADLVLDGVEVSDAQELHIDNLQGVLKDAYRHRLAANCQLGVGAMEGMLDATVAYAKVRQQFGTPISRLQAVQHRLVDMYAQLQLAKAVAITALMIAPDDTDGTRLSACKARVAQSCRFIREQGVQLHGGIGMTDECIASHYFRRLLALEKSDGDALHHLGRLAQASEVAEI